MKRFAGPRQVTCVAEREMNHVHPNRFLECLVLVRRACSDTRHGQRFVFREKIHTPRCQSMAGLRVHISRHARVHISFTNCLKERSQRLPPSRADYRRIIRPTHPRSCSDPRTHVSTPTEGSEMQLNARRGSGCQGSVIIVLTVQRLAHCLAEHN